jgi:hypothetical protein
LELVIAELLAAGAQADLSCQDCLHGIGAKKSEK